MIFKAFLECILQNEINVLWLDFCSRNLVFFKFYMKLHILSIEAIKLKCSFKVYNSLYIGKINKITYLNVIIW